MADESARRCVYTAVIGTTESLNEQPVKSSSKMRFICLTDDPGLGSDTWEIRRVQPLFAMDPTRSQRDLKIRPFAHLHDFDASLYIDNTVLLKVAPEEIYDRYLQGVPVAVPWHSFRDTVLDEFIEVAVLGLDNEDRIFEQLNHYSSMMPERLTEHPYWCGILLRDHTSKQARELSDIWGAHVMRYSRRDQLSFNVAAALAGVAPLAIEVSNHSSWFHQWPTGGQQHDRHPAAKLRPLLARVRSQQLDIAEKSAAIADLTAAIAKLTAEK